MAEDTACPECGAVWPAGHTCRMYFEQMLAWEFEDISGAGAVHHLSVLSYNIQHPSVYSPQGLAYAIDLLRAFVERGAMPEAMRRQNRSIVDSGRRTWRFTGEPAAHNQPIVWPVTIVDVVPQGLEGYCARVEVWARSVCEALQGV